MSLSIHDRHLVDRYLQGELSGIELEDFSQRLDGEKVFRNEVDLLQIIYSGINLAKEEQLRKKILGSINYRKSSIPFALKLIFVFLFVTVSIITLWFYAGIEYSEREEKKPWYSFLDKDFKNIKSEKKSNQKIKIESAAKSKMPESKDEMMADTNKIAGAEPTAEESLSGKPDSNDIRTSEDIIVKQDQLLISADIPITDKTKEDNKSKMDSLLTAEAAQKLSSSADLPEQETKVKAYQVEFWVSPVNYRGYKMSKNKIILFGIEEPDAVKLYRVNDAIYMNYLKAFYELEPGYDFRAYQKLRESEIPLPLR